MTDGNPGDTAAEARIALSPEIATRDEFPLLLNERGMYGLFVEIGVHRAEFAAAFLRRWTGPYVGVDPWLPYPEMEWARTADFEQAIIATQPFGGRVKLVREADSEAVADAIVTDYGSPIFVYVDGDHGYEACAEDIAIWWPRLAEDGILAGHDYTLEQPGVVRAVNEFADERGVAVWLTHDFGWKSWYAYRSPPDKLRERYQSVSWRLP